MSTPVDAKEAKKESKSGITGKIKVKLMSVFALVLMAFTLTAPVAAGALNDSISPILTDVASLFTPLLALIIAAVPLIIAVAVISFVTGIFKEIVAKIGM